MPIHLHIYAVIQSTGHVAAENRIYKHANTRSQKLKLDGLVIGSHHRRK